VLDYDQLHYLMGHNYDPSNNAIVDDLASPSRLLQLLITLKFHYVCNSKNEDSMNRISLVVVYAMAIPLVLHI